MTASSGEKKQMLIRLTDDLYQRIKAEAVLRSLTAGSYVGVGQVVRDALDSSLERLPVLCARLDGFTHEAREEARAALESRMSNARRNYTKKVVDEAVGE